jgi:UDP-N-acetylglucosamine 2-epimerase (non-hydrolysing)
MPPLSVTFVVGARPNFMKVAPLIHEARSRRVPAYLIHTGQHFSPEMSKAFFDDLDIPEPDCNLGVSGDTQIQQMAAIMARLEPVLSARAADTLVVVGDVTSTVAAALTGVKLGIRVAHVEAGLRSFDRTMPEEINRIVTDSVSDLLFITEPSGRENLLREGVPEERIFFTGNVMIDTLLRHRARARQSKVLEELRLTPREYGVVTLHRPSNVDDPARLLEVLHLLDTIGRRLRLVFPVHPRTQQRMQASGVAPANLLIVPPQGYLDFIHLMANARLVLTDSGGIQEETTILGVPCLTMRENTERPITLTRGTNRLIGVEPTRILAVANEALDAPMPDAVMPELWDGAAAARILEVLQNTASAATVPHAESLTR